MTREEILKEALKLKCNNILLELATGVGKSRIALELMSKKVNKTAKVLIVYPKVALKQNWIDEIKKWGFEGYNISFTTYCSLYKHVGVWDLIIYDECHHLSPLKMSYAKEMNSRYNLLLSATIGYKMWGAIYELFKGKIYRFKVGVKEAIDNEVLPTPNILLVPLQLNNTDVTEFIQVNKSAKGYVRTVDYNHRFEAYRNRNKPYIINCTQAQKYYELNQTIEYYRNRNTLVFLNKCNERLKWLGNIKTFEVRKILNLLKNKRTLTFCGSIDQCNALGKNSIHSKDPNHLETLEKFNNNEIDHITTVEILSEGVNLTSCQFGVWATLNSSERLIAQKFGRILRHKNPYFIIPYYEDTREEEIVAKMVEGIKNIFICPIYKLKSIL